MEIGTNFADPSNCYWTDQTYLTEGSQHYPDIYTILVHELGHVFLGPGHGDGDPQSVTVYNSYQVRRSLTTCDISIVRNFYNPMYTIIAQNNFGGIGGDSVIVDGSKYSSPAQFTWRESTFPHTLRAIDGKNIAGYVRRFSQWTGPGGFNSGSISVSIGVSDGTYTAYFAKEFNITFQNSLPGAGNGGAIMVNGTQYTSPTSAFHVLQGNSITAQALSQIIYGIQCTFEYAVSSWSPGGSTSASTTFTPTDHTTYTANFNARPMPPTNLSAGGAVGDYVCVTWTDNPNPNVTQYQVWRQPKWQSNQLVATVSAGVGSWTDPIYMITGTSSDQMIFYDVRSVYSVNGATSEPGAAITFATKVLERLAQDNRNKITWRVEDVPMDYAVSNYPNPFNPSTTIQFDLPEASFVRLRVFDVLGREVAVLVEEEKSAGIYTVTFDASKLPSGMYFYHIEAGNFTETRKMVLLK